MLDRQKIVAVLRRRFPGAAIEQVAAAANAIVGLEDDWIELPEPEGGWGSDCRPTCGVRQAAHHGLVKVLHQPFKE